MANKTISIGSFVEYSQANPHRRQKIIEEVLTPPRYLTDTKYPNIERATSHYLASSCKDSQRLEDLDLDISQIKARTAHHETRLLNAHDAIELVRTMDWPLPDSTSIELATELP